MRGQLRRLSRVGQRGYSRRWVHTGHTAEPPANAAMVGSGIGRMSNMVVESGKGCWVWTENGEKYLDFATGIGVVSLGHCHPKVTAAVHEQVDKIWHAQVNITHHKPMMELVENLKGAMPSGSGLDTFLFVTSGSEAVECAVKLARHATKKPNVIVIQGGYHGRTLLTMSMTTSKTIYRGGYGPHAAGIHVCPYPFYQKSTHIDDPVAWTEEQLELVITQQTTAEETGCLVIEPVLGEGGYVPHPPGFHEMIRKFCDKHNILWVADEVQSGFGRTGKMFAVEHWSAHPDVLIFAKGIATGMPLAGIASRKELMATQPGGSQGGTYAGNAVACAAANAVLKTIGEDNVLNNVNARGQQIRDGLSALHKEGKFHIIDVRGPGLMIALEFDTKTAEKGIAAKVSKACLSRGLIVLPTGIYETLRLIPALIITEEEVDIALKIIREALVDVTQS